MGSRILTPELAKQIISDAASLGLPVVDYLESIIRSEANGEKPFYETASAQEWIEALNRLADKSPESAASLR